MQSNGAVRDRHRSPEEEQAFFDLLSRVQISDWTYDPADSTVRWRRSFVDSQGKAGDIKLDRLDKVLSRYHEKDRINLLQHYKKVLETGYDGPVRFRVYNAEHEITYIESTAIRVDLPDGKTKVCGVFRNCHTDVRNERVMTGLGSLVNQIADKTSSGLLAVDLRGCVISVNKPFLKIFRQSEKAIPAGRSVANLAGIVGKGAITDIQNAIKNSSASYGTRAFPSPGGRTREMSYCIYPLFKEAGEVGGVVFRVDDQPKASGPHEAELVFEASSVPTIIVDCRSGRMVKLNDAAKKRFAITSGTATVQDKLLSNVDYRKLVTHIGTVGGETCVQCDVTPYDGPAEHYLVHSANLRIPGGAARNLVILQFSPAPENEGLLSRLLSRSAGDKPEARRLVG